jgi:hypothetical protein
MTVLMIFKRLKPGAALKLYGKYLAYAKENE